MGSPRFEGSFVDARCGIGHSIPFRPRCGAAGGEGAEQVQEATKASGNPDGRPAIGFLRHLEHEKIYNMSYIKKKSSEAKSRICPILQFRLTPRRENNKSS